MTKTIDDYSLKELQVALTKKQQSTENAQREKLYNQLKIKTHAGKGVIVKADDLIILIEALSGNRSELEKINVIDTLHFADYLNPVSLVTSALAGAKSSLDKLTQKQPTISAMLNDTEVIHQVPLALIEQVADEIEEDFEHVGLFDTLSVGETDTVMTAVLGKSLTDIRSDDCASFSPKLYSLIKEAIRDDLFTALIKMGKIVVKDPKKGDLPED